MYLDGKKKLIFFGVKILPLSHAAFCSTKKKLDCQI